MAKSAKKPVKKPAPTRRAASPKKAPKRQPTATSPRPAATGPRAPKTRPGKETEPKVLPIEVEPGTVEATLERVRQEVKHWVNKGRHTKVRFKLRGKPILPDLPVAAVLAVEAATFWWAGLLRVLLVNVGAKALLDMELINDAVEQVHRGKAMLLAGELDRAVEAFEKAVEMDRDCAAAHLNLGIARKLSGDKDRARTSLQTAARLDPDGPMGEEARRILDQLLGVEPAPPPVAG